MDIKILINKDIKKNITLDTEDGSEWTIKTLSKFVERKGGNWTKVWEGIKDISVKTIFISICPVTRTYIIICNFLLYKSILFEIYLFIKEYF